MITENRKNEKSVLINIVFSIIKACIEENLSPKAHTPSSSASLGAVAVAVGVVVSL